MYENNKRTYFYPPSYEDNNKNRSAKRKNYNYTKNQDYVDGIQPSKQYAASVNQDFSFQDRSNKQERSIRNYKQRISVEKPDFAESNYVQNSNVSPLRESGKKKDFDLRVNNIDSITDKISNLLNMVRKDNGETKQFKVSQIKQKRVNQSIRPFQTFGEKTQPLYSFSPLGKNVKDDKIILDKQNRRSKNYSILEYDGKFKNVEVNNQESQNQNSPSKQNPPFKQYKYDFSFTDRQLSQKNDLSIQESKNNINTKTPIQKENSSQRKNSSKNPVKYYDEVIFDQQTLNKQRADIYAERQKRENIIKKNTELDAKIYQIKNKIHSDSPIKKPKNQNKKDDQSNTPGKRARQLFGNPKQQLKQKPCILKMAKRLSQMIDIQIKFRKIRESFQTCKDKNKWNLLISQLRSRKIFLEQKQLQEIITISIHQKNPFKSVVEQFAFNSQKDLARLYEQAQQFWKIDLQKCVQKDQLDQEEFQMAYIDLNKKNFISIEDLVCFVNIHSQMFYRSRDVASLFNRFLKLQGKTLDKNLSEGILFSTFMEKLSK